MRRRAWRWTDLLGLVGLVMLLGWTPAYMAQDDGDVETERVVLPPPRDGMRLETAVVITLGDGTSYQVGPWVDVAIDADSDGEGQNWTVTVSRHPANLEVGGLRFEQRAAVERRSYDDSVRVEALVEEDRWYEDGQEEVLVHVSAHEPLRDHELVSARFPDLEVARDVVEAVVEVVTRVPNVDPGDGGAQKAASSVSGRIVRFGDLPLYAANGGDLRRVANTLGGVFGAEARGGVLCDHAFTEPYTALYVQGSIRWMHDVPADCMQYKWDWYHPDWPAPVGFHRELFDANGKLLFELDVIPVQVDPGTFDVVPPMPESERRQRVEKEPWRGDAATLGESLTAPQRWGGLWTTGDFVDVLRAEAVDTPGWAHEMIGVRSISWLDRERVAEHMTLRPACTWSSASPVVFWVELYYPNDTFLRATFSSGRLASERPVVEDLAWMASPSETGRTQETATTAWWAAHQVWQKEAAERLERAGGAAPLVPWLGTAGTLSFFVSTLAPNADPCRDVALGPLGLVSGTHPADGIVLVTGTETQNSTAMILVGFPFDGSSQMRYERIHIGAGPGTADMLAGPFASTSGMPPAAMTVAPEVEVVRVVGPSVGVAGLAALSVAIVARLIAALRAGAWMSLGAALHRGDGGLSRRDEVERFVASHPGITVSELVGGLELGWGVTLHHVEALRRSGRILRLADGARVHLFALDGDSAPRTEAERWHHIVTRRPRYADVWNAMRERSAVTATELSKEVGRHRSSVSRTLDRLRSVGLVEAERSGRETRFRLSR